MAKHDIKMVCGHIETHQIFGKMDSRPGQVRATAQSECADCWHDRVERENRLAADTNRALGMPDLRGSPKQVSWAESIRDQTFKDALDLLANLESQARAHGYSDDDIRTIAAKHRGSLDVVMSQASASWWIDRRGSSPKTLLAEAEKAIAELRQNG